MLRLVNFLGCSSSYGNDASMHRGAAMIPQEEPKKQDPGDDLLVPPDDGWSVELSFSQSSIYVALLVIPSSIPGKVWSEKPCSCIMTVLPIAVFFVCTLIAQVLFIKFVWQEAMMVDPDSKQSCDHDQTLRLLAAFSFTGTVSIELFDNIQMLGWIWVCPRADHMTPLKQDVRKSGLTVAQKLIFTFTILAKILLSLALGFTGFVWLVNSADKGSDLILNCMALAFIFQIDEMLYTLITPSYFQRVIASMQPLTVNSNDSDGCSKLVTSLDACSPIIKSCIWFAATLIPAHSHQTHCDSLANYE
eukprot:TRINITY_DN16914_c0_g2_i3.p1 TRINITY_DN16914_c0_g2~~TRINITY_DN16914_c0_g2_i3.p1  ORF type:complete len:304 (-),score=30.98 TRINITY_DN16914_c0_g2_i3:532-1443(-)